ncbi:hypothetical protein YC2023_031812 [Brassica napus]
MSTPTSGTFSATTVEIPKRASIYVKEVPTKSPTKSTSVSDNGGDETDFPITTTEIIVSRCKEEKVASKKRKGSIEQLAASHVWTENLFLSLSLFFKENELN